MSRSPILLPGARGLSLVLKREPIGGCDLCSVPFYSTRDARAHMETVEHRDAVDEAIVLRRAKQGRLSFLFADPDPEVAEHMRQVGSRMIREGRLTVRKSERAGFS